MPSRRILALPTGLLAGLLLLAGLSAGTATSAPAPSAPPRRAVAVTIDDLPAVPVNDLRKMREVTDRLLGHLRALKIPAVGFVNEGKLHAGGPGEVQARTVLLRRWVDAGLELGNHTYSHWDLHRTPRERMEADVIQGETVTSGLLQARGQRLRYFRHPFLRTGADPQVRSDFDRFLAGRGYTVAPVTFDNDEWIYAAAYDRAKARGDRKLMRRIGDDYLRYMDEVFTFYEKLAREVAGREIRHVLLLHANALNAEYFDDLAARLKARGYAFISLEEALRDDVYRLPAPYTGLKGVSWLQRWALAQGREIRDQPAAGAWVQAVR